MRREPWRCLRERWDSLNLGEKLVLIHPDWLRDSGASDDVIARIRGPRAFSASTFGRCSAERLWGYECPLGSRCEMDHLWPYAFGGPTKPGNAVILCREHNALKGIDIHAYPWEEPIAPALVWLDEQVAMVDQALGRLGV